MKLFAQLLFVCLCTPIASAATYGGGTGQPNNPYQIWTAAQMNTIGTEPNDWDKSFKLMADIDMSAYTVTQYNIIGNDTTPFTGTFDGKGYVIRYLTYTTIAAVDYVGMFGCAEAATIRNLGLRNISISSGGNNIGGLAGKSQYGLVTNCYVTGSVSGVSHTGGMVGDCNDTLTVCHMTGSVTSVGNSNDTGGLVGRSYGTLTACYATGLVEGDFYVGGLVGTNYGTLNGCYATDSVSGDSCVGGLVGEDDGSLTNCYATGSVDITGDCAGGLVGSVDQGALAACFATGSVDATGNCAGGLAGYNYYGSITDCHANGSANANISLGAGGLVGNNSYGTITSCYSTGSASGSFSVGGLVGYNSGSITASFWDTDSSGLTTSAGGTGKTTAEMRMLPMFVSAGWDFAGVWGIGNRQTRPYLKSLTGFSMADLNYSGTVDFQDFALMATDWMQ